jgi:hypothetical protein
MGLFFADWNCIAQIHGPAAFTDVIAIPRWDFHFDVTLDYALATQARSPGQPRGHIKSIGFVVVHFRKVLHLALRDDYVACGAGIVASTGVFQVDTEVETDVQNRFGFPVFMIRKLTLLVLYSLPVDRYLWHISLYR